VSDNFEAKLNFNHSCIYISDSRIDSLCEADANASTNISFSSIFHMSSQEKAISKKITTFGVGLLVWMQMKAANLLGSKLGGELVAATKEAHLMGSTVVLG